MANKKLLIDTLAHIKLYPEHWDQKVWAKTVGNDDTVAEKANDPTACGTAYCFAGWACSLNGDKFEVEPYGDLDEYEFEINTVLVDGESIPIEFRADEILDIEEEGIYFEENSYETLVYHVAHALGTSENKVNELVAKRVLKLKAKAAKKAENVIQEIADLQREFELLELTVNREILV